jgi:hypothetical protein
VLRFNNGVPFQVQLSARPLASYPRANHNVGIYAQDRRTIRCLDPENNTYGPSWQVPSSIQPGRILQLGVQVTF